MAVFRVRVRVLVKFVHLIMQNVYWTDRPTPLLTRASGADQQISQHSRAAH